MSQDFVYTLEFLGTFYEYSHRTWGFDCFTCVYLFPDSGVIKSHTRMQFKKKKPLSALFVEKYLPCWQISRDIQRTHTEGKSTSATIITKLSWNVGTLRHTLTRILTKRFTQEMGLLTASLVLSHLLGEIFNFLSWNTCNLTETAKISQILIFITSLFSL